MYWFITFQMKKINEAPIMGNAVSTMHPVTWLYERVKVDPTVGLQIIFYTEIPYKQYSLMMTLPGE